MMAHCLAGQILKLQIRLIGKFYGGRLDCVLLSVLSQKVDSWRERGISSITFATDKNRLTKIVSLQDLMQRKQVLM